MLPPEHMYPAGEPRIHVQYITLTDGTKVRVIESIPAQRDAVLLVHGWGSSVYSFSETIPAIAAAGYRAVAFDLPGHGLSDKPRDDEKYTTMSLANAVIEVADALELRRFSLVGHSLGGLLGLELAMRGEKRIERLILINPPGIGRTPIIPILRVFSPSVVEGLVARVLSRGLVEFILRRAFGSRERPRSRDVDEYWAPAQFDGFVHACRASLHRVNWKRQSATRLRSVRIPLLLIIGGRDRIVPGNARRARQMLPTAQTVLIPEGGHLVMQECATKTNAKLLLFLPGGRGRR
jgi:pimeloyl-ACP methyl ester carboxylesterase